MLDTRLNILRAVTVAGSLALMLLVSAVAQAAGLGRMTVLSALGQPLNAEIELNATKEELSTMQARIASPDAYRRANLEFTALAASVRLAVETRADGGLVLRATSARPVNEPFIELLVELTWANGRLVREYTSLIDPPSAISAVTPPAAATPPAARTVPVPDTPAPAATPAPAPVAAPSEKPAPARAAAKPRAEPAPASPAPAAAPAAGAGETYTVRRGDTLGRIAESSRGSGVSLEQMLVAMVRENKEAFDAGNMNRLRTGAVLRIPDAASAGAIAQADAAREVRTQVADFNAYRQRLAGAVEQAAPASEGGQGAASGQVSARVRDAAAPAKGGDVLQVSKGGAPTAAGREGKGAGPAAKAEDDQARANALREANDRVAALEKMLKETQQLLALQSKQLAELQKGTGKGEPPKPAPEPAKAAEPPKPVPAAPVTPEPPKPADPPKPAPAPAADPAKPAEPAKADAPPAAPVTPEPPKPAEPPKPRPAPPPPPPPPPTLIDQVFGFVQNFMLELAGGLVAVLGGIWLALRRRKGGRAEPAAAAAAVAAAQPAKPAGPRPPDSMVSTVPGRSAEELAQAPSDEEVDPLAEAEVYLSYGRDAQAEEILREAVVRQPGRNELRMKLLEIYMKRVDRSAFEEIATELFAATGGQGADWVKAAEMGAMIDPDNPLYAAGRASVQRSGAMDATVATMAGAATLAGAAAAAAAPRSEDRTEGFDPQRTQVMAPSAAPGTTNYAGAARPPLAPEPAPSASDFDSTMLALDSPQGGNAGDMDFTLDFDAPGASGDGPPPTLPDLALDLGGSLPQADIDIDPAHTRPLGALGGDVVDPMAPGIDLSATNVFLDAGTATGSSIEFQLDDGQGSGPDTGAVSASLEATNILQSPGELVSFDMTNPAGLPANWQDSTLPRVDLNLGDAGGAGERDERWNDVNTKYDLAKAYEEMGDKDGAREILREVIAEGDAQQRADAEAMLARLG